MTSYLIYRTGSNSANQTCEFDGVPIAIVRAKNQSKACETTWEDSEPSIHSCPTLAAEVEAAAEDAITVYANQFLHAVPESRAKGSDWNSVLTSDAMRRAWDDCSK